MTTERHGLKVGQVVAFTNDYGVRFAPYRITRFATPAETLYSGADVFLDKTSWWCPVKASSLEPLDETSSP